MRETLRFDAEEGDVVRLIGRKDFDDREEAPIGGHDTHSLGGGVRGHMVVCRDDSVGADCEAAGE